MLDQSCEHLRPVLESMLRAGLTQKWGWAADKGNGQRLVLNTNGYTVHAFNRKNLPDCVQIESSSSTGGDSIATAFGPHIRCDDCWNQIILDERDNS